MCHHLGSLAACLFIVWILPHQALAQIGSDTLSVKNIRIKKLADGWLGAKVTLALKDGSRITGIFTATDFYTFTLTKGGQKSTYPIEDVQAVIFRPGPMEAVLTIVSAGLGGGLIAGMIHLTAPDSPTTTKAGAGIMGAGLGLWWGYRTFFQEIVVPLDG